MFCEIGKNGLFDTDSRQPRRQFGLLDKLGISERAQGLGLGATLWNRIRHDHHDLYWRSRPDNPANKWYLARADGMHRTPDWLVFWYGHDTRDRIEACIADALSSDAATLEADLRGALETGAQVISCDVPAPRPDVPFHVEMPGGTPSRCNPVTAPADCTPEAIEDPARL